MAFIFGCILAGFAFASAGGSGQATISENPSQNLFTVKIQGEKSACLENPSFL